MGSRVKKVDLFWLVVCAGPLALTAQGCPTEQTVVTTVTTGPDAKAGGQDVQGSDGDPDVAAPVDTGETSGPPDTGGGLPNIDQFLPAGPVTRKASCKDPNPGDFGESLPWKGFEYEGKTYTCNLCPTGDEYIQGEWRVVFGDTEDPDTPLTDGYKEVLTFEGNVWRQHTIGKDLGKTVESWMTGYYFCGDVAEVPDQQKVFVVTSVTPEGAYGWTSGLVFSGKTFKQGSDKLLFNYYTEFLAGANYNDLYCRIGKEVETLSGAKKYCGDPFSE